MYSSANWELGWRGFSFPLLSLCPSDQLIPSSQEQRQTYDPHTEERTKALETGSTFRRTTFHSFSPGGAPAPLTVWWGCSHHIPLLHFPRSSRLSTDKQFSCFSPPSASRRVNLVPCCSSFSHTPDSSGSQSMQPCATFSAPLEMPFYSPVVQGRRTVCIHIICGCPSTFSFLGALQHV